MKRKIKKTKNKTSSKKTTSSPKKAVKKLSSKSSTTRQSKSPDFLEKIRGNNPMLEYFNALNIINPAAHREKFLNEPKREGSFVRLAHAKEEFQAPKISKGKSVTPPQPKKNKSKD